MEKEVKYENSKKKSDACIEWYEKCTIERCSPDNQVALREVGKMAWGEHKKKVAIKFEANDPWVEFETYLLLKEFKKDDKGNIILEKKSSDQDDEKNSIKTYKVKMAAAKSAEHFVSYIHETFRDVVRERLCSDYAGLTSKGTKRKKIKFVPFNEDVGNCSSDDYIDLDDYDEIQKLSESISDDESSKIFKSKDMNNKYDFNEPDSWCSGCDEDLDIYHEDVNSDTEENTEEGTEEDTEKDSREANGVRSQLDDYYNPERNIQRTISQIEQDPLVAPIIKDLKKWLSNEDNMEYVKVCANLIQLNDGSKNENIENRDEEQLEKDKKLLSDVKQNPKNYGLGRNKSATYEATNKAGKLLVKLRKILSKEDVSTVIKEYFKF